MVTKGINRRAAAVVASAFVVLFAGSVAAQRAGQPRRTVVQTGEDYARPVELTAEEREIFERTNEYRQKCGLPRVSLNPQLTRAARYFAIYMSITGDFDHDADGKGPGARAAKFGYDWSLVCENIAYRYKAYDPSLRDLPSDFVDGWIQSAGHRKNMLCDEVLETGVGVAVGKNPRHQYSVQVFGKPRGQVYTFKIQNDSGGNVRYVLGRQSFTLRPGHTRIHPDSESFPTYFESVGRDGKPAPIPMQRRDVPSPSYRIVLDRNRCASVVTGPS
jgi:uncharacterized protein YkwD